MSAPDISKDARMRELRKCAKCSAPMRVTSATNYFVNGGYSGRSYDHRCGQCGAEFTSVSAYRFFSRGFPASLFFFGGIGMVVGFLTELIPLYDDSLQGYAIAYGIAAALTIGGVLYALPLVKSVLGRMRNPIMPSGAG